MKTTFIYALNCPITGDCRYVGKADRPGVRLTEHINKAGKGGTRKNNWIKSLSLAGLKPVLEILQEVPTEAWQLWERTWIKASREIGYDLTNLAEGGIGRAPGYKLTPDHKRKIGLGNSGKKLSEAAKAKISAALTGVRLSPERCANSGAGRKGLKRNLAAIEKTIVTKRSRKQRSNTSGFVGVNLHKETGKYTANITLGKSRKYLGIFKDKYDAVFVRHLAEDKYFA